MFGSLTRPLKWRYERLAHRLEAHRIAAQLAQSRQYSFTTDWISTQVKHWRQDFAKFAGCPGVRMLEIGSFEGRSAVWFLENVLTHPTSRLICVDPFLDPLVELRFDHNMKLCEAGARLDKRRAFSEKVLPQLERASFDLIYVDGLHRAPTVLFDAMLSWELLKPGGVLTFDDYEWEPQRTPEDRPKLAIDLFLSSHAGRYDILHRGYQITVSKKEPS
jgi:predicted O-methyltransferase YrrM